MIKVDTRFMGMVAFLCCPLVDGMHDDGYVGGTGEEIKILGFFCLAGEAF
jgi:hypothetical protein